MSKVLQRIGQHDLLLIHWEDQVTEVAVSELYDTSGHSSISFRTHTNDDRQRVHKIKLLIGATAYFMIFNRNLLKLTRVGCLRLMERPGRVMRFVV